jgi:hypothetical protein
VNWELDVAFGDILRVLHCELSCFAPDLLGQFDVTLKIALSHFDIGQHFLDSFALQGNL